MISSASLLGYHGSALPIAAFDRGVGAIYRDAGGCGADAFPRFLAAFDALNKVSPTDASGSELGPPPFFSR